MRLTSVREGRHTGIEAHFVRGSHIVLVFLVDFDLVQITYEFVELDVFLAQGWDLGVRDADSLELVLHLLTLKGRKLFLLNFKLLIKHHRRLLAHLLLLLIL